MGESEGGAGPSGAAADELKPHLRSGSACVLCPSKSFQSDAAWKNHLRKADHVRRERVYTVLMEELESEAGESEIAGALGKAGPPADPAELPIGQASLHEVRAAQGDAAMAFWACSACYVAQKGLGSALEHVASAEHRRAYLSQMHSDRIQGASTADEARLLLAAATQAVHKEEKDLQPEVMRLREPADLPKVIEQLGVDKEVARPAVAAVPEPALPALDPSDAPKVLKRTADMELVWCEECWAALVITLRSTTTAEVWKKHKLTTGHIKKLAARSKLALDEEDFVPGEPSLGLQRELARAPALVGVKYMAERHLDGLKSRRHKDVVCLLCALTLPFDQVYGHIASRAHLGQFLHKEHPDMIIKLSKAPVASRPTIITEFFESRKSGGGKMRVFAPAIAALARAHSKRAPADPLPDKLARLQAQIFILLLESETMEMSRAVAVSPEAVELQGKLRSHADPLLGLQHVVEVNANGDGALPSYVCRICPAWESIETLVEHLVSHGHRKAFLVREDRKEELSALRKLTGKAQMAKMTDVAEKLEAELGRKPMKRRLRYRPSVHVLERLWPHNDWTQKKGRKEERREESRSSSKDKDTRRPSPPRAKRPSSPSRGSSPAPKRSAGGGGGFVMDMTRPKGAAPLEPSRVPTRNLARPAAADTGDMSMEEMRRLVAEKDAALKREKAERERLQAQLATGHQPPAFGAPGQFSRPPPPLMGGPQQSSQNKLANALRALAGSGGGGGGGGPGQGYGQRPLNPALLQHLGVVNNPNAPNRPPTNHQPQQPYNGASRYYP